MARAKPTLVRLSDMKPGQLADFFAVLAERTRGSTREGKPYFSCRFRDKQRQVSCMLWSDTSWYQTCDSDWRQGQFFKLRATVIEHERYGLQIDIQNIRPVIPADREDGFEASDLIGGSRHDPDAMLAELKGLAEEHIKDEPLRRLTRTLLDRHGEALKRLPATHHHFFPFPGGLLEHTLSVTRSCIMLADKYVSYYAQLQPPLNRDLIVAGAILHDLGRVLEFGDDVLAAQPTVPGRFMGHLLLGRDLVRDMGRELGDVNPDLLQMLEHIVLTHLALPEWGSPRLPLVPECLIIHHADDMDAKLEMYARCLSNDHSPGPFTERDPVLNRHLYKGRSV